MLGKERAVPLSQNQKIGWPNPLWPRYKAFVVMYNQSMDFCDPFSKYHVGTYQTGFSWEEKICMGWRPHVLDKNGPWVPSQYTKRRLSVRSRKVSKPRDLYLELSDRSEIWQALRQQCCRCACQISKRYDNLKYQSHGFESLRDLKKRRLFGYRDGALGPI